MLEALILSAVALIIAPGQLFYFDVTPKTAVLLAGMAALLLLWRGRRPPRIFSILIALYLISLAISTALSTRPALSLIGTSWREYGLIPQAAVLVFAWLVAARPESLQPVLRSIAICGVAASLYGTAQYFGIDPFLPAKAYHIGEGIWTIVRPPGTLGYASYFASWLLVSAFLSMGLATLEHQVAWRRLAYVAAALSCFAMLLTGTRAAMVGLAAGCAVWLLLRGFRITRPMAAVALIALAALGAFYFSPAGWNLRSRARWFVEDPSGGARPALWRDTLRMAAHSPVAGYGPEVFNAEFPRFESRELAAAYPDFAYESPHNIFLDALVAQGIPGLLLLCGICAAGFAAGIRLRKGEAAWLTAALAAGLVSQQFTVFTVPTGLIFFTTAALLAGRAAQTAPALRIHRALAIPVAVALLFVAVRLIMAGHVLELTRLSIQSGSATEAAAHYARYEKWRLPGGGADIWYSRAALQLAQQSRDPMVRLQALVQAQAAAARAPQTAEDPENAWYNLAEFDALRNNAPAAEKDLRAAIASHPNWFKPHWTLARLLSLEGRRPEALREATLAVQLDGGKNPEVSRTMSDIQAQASSSSQK